MQLPEFAAELENNLVSAFRLLPLVNKCIAKVIDAAEKKTHKS